MENQNLMNSQSNWAKIPPNLLIKIAKLATTNNNNNNSSNPISLSSNLQILRLRAVCKPWRSTLFLFFLSEFRRDITIPVEFPPPKLFSSSNSLYYVPGESFCFVPTTVCIVRSVVDPSESHLLLVDHLSADSGKVSCRNPLLPNLDRSDSWVGVESSRRSINLLDYRVDVVAEEYGLRFLYSKDNGVNWELNKGQEDSCDKSVLIVNRKLNREKIIDGVAFVLFDGGKLAQYSFSDGNWGITVCDGKKTKCSDIQRFGEDGCIVIDHKANAFLVKYDFKSRSTSWTKIAAEVTGSRGRRKRLIVDSVDGKMFLLVQNVHAHETYKLMFKVSFMVYGLNKEASKWEKVTAVPGRILFVGTDLSFTATDKDFPGICDGNCIFCSNGSFPKYNSKGSDDAPYAFWYGDVVVYYLGKNFADEVCNVEWGGLGGCPIFASPGKWLQPKLPKQPSASLLQLQIALKKQPEVMEAFMGDKNPQERGKRKDDDQPSSAKNPNLNQDMEAIQKSLAVVTKLTHNPVQQIQSDPSGVHGLSQVIQKLGSEPGSGISACLLVQNKGKRQLYVSHGGENSKRQWLHCEFDIPNI